MPELPEVETVVQGLTDAGLTGLRILKAEVWNPRTIATPGVPAFLRQIQGRRILRVWRRGKFIVLSLEPDLSLLVHLRMTGRLSVIEKASDREPHEHVRFSLDDGRALRFRDPRKFGRIYLLSDSGSVLGALGPEPLSVDFTPEVFRGLLAGRQRKLKPLLLDQAFLAGLGNIYVDEALWEAQLHPARQANSLRAEERTRLYHAIRKVLRRGIRARGTSLGKASTNFEDVEGRRGRNQTGLQVFRKTGEPCPRCGQTLVRITLAQRSTHLCPACQSA